MFYLQTPAAKLLKYVGREKKMTLFYAIKIRKRLRNKTVRFWAFQ
jgi:hypothetical protein